MIKIEVESTLKLKYKYFCKTPRDKAYFITVMPVSVTIVFRAYLRLLEEFISVLLFILLKKKLRLLSKYQQRA